MLSTRLKGKIMPTSNKPQKINMRITTSQYETSGKNNTHLLRRNLPAGGEKSLEQAAFWHEVKVVCCLGSNWNSSDFP